MRNVAMKQLKRMRNKLAFIGLLYLIGLMLEDAQKSPVREAEDILAKAVDPKMAAAVHRANARQRTATSDAYGDS